MDGLALPDEWPLVSEPLLPINTKPTEVTPHRHAHVYNMPPDTSGQAKTKLHVKDRAELRPIQPKPPTSQTFFYVPLVMPPQTTAPGNMMPPVVGCASATSTVSRIFVIFLVPYLVWSALSINGYVAAAVQNDRHTLFSIKMRIENFSVTWSGRQYFTPKLECSTSSPEYLLLAKPRGRRRKRGSRAGVQTKQRKQRAQRSGSGSMGSERCLRPVPVWVWDWNAVVPPPSRSYDRIFPTPDAHISLPRKRVLRPFTRIKDGASVRAWPGRPV
ncbi:hypothetical protein NL108_014637 [Boleophthalmus pectinirostris]|nr:hypothetical protein NL108_014637 [Boleophthalmus pectinirostris]